ncbi:MAG: divergent polysaccharide deacetylase family protein [Deltaproteobacteria bacterium]|nr:divergent polysaccharide deacetylase family protein [Deltaproteobacteria bacterium]
MADKDAEIKRREFIYKSAFFLTGSLLGLRCRSKAFACPCFEKTPQISIIIDDIGFSESRLDRFLGIGAPFTFSILPKLPMSSCLAEKIHREGYEVMLHQPMEPLDPAIDPGPGALYVNDPPDRIADIIKQNISETPFVTGINNHMGSRFTACGTEMKEALSVVRDEGLFFVDSLTTSQSTGYNTAKTMHISTIRRNVFIDNIQEECFVRRQLEKLKRLAVKHGQAIGIGHPFPETAKVLNHFFQEIRTTNISMVPISHLLA